jgi:hypothetical protein
MVIMTYLHCSPDLEDHAIFLRTSRKALKSELGDVDDEKEHDSAELGFMFEAPDDDDDDDDDDEEVEDEDDEEADVDEVHQHFYSNLYKYLFWTQS